MAIRRPPGPKRARKRRDHALDLEVERCAGAIGLRRDHEIVAGDRSAGARQDRLEQEVVVLAIDHQHDRPLERRVAGLRIDAGLPGVAEERLKFGDLGLEFVRVVSLQAQLVPDHARGGAHRLHGKPRRIGVIEVGQHDDGRRMLEETVRQFLQRQADVFEADFLADDVERRVRIAVVHGAHHARQHAAVADAGIEYAQRRRARMKVWQFLRDAVRDHQLFAAGIHEQQIFLPVVEKAEIALRIGVRPLSQ